MSRSRAEDPRFAGGSRPAAISGSGCGYFPANELEEKRKQFHKNFRLVPSATVTPGLDFFLCFQELDEEVLLQFHRVTWLGVER